MTVRTWNLRPFGPLAVCSRIQPARTMELIAFRVVNGWPPKRASARSRTETVR